MVYASYLGRCPAGRIALPREFMVPKTLADLLNGIGTIVVQGGGISVCPEPEAVPADAALALNQAVTFAMLSSFSSLVEAARVRNIIRISTLTGAVKGTAWWILSARQTANPAVVANNSDSVAVFGVFKEWTPADGLMSALVQNQYNGMLATDAALKWSMDFVVGVPGLRRASNINT